MVEKVKVVAYSISNFADGKVKFPFFWTPGLDETWEASFFLGSLFSTGRLI